MGVVGTLATMVLDVIENCRIEEKGIMKKDFEQPLFQILISDQLPY